MKIEIMGVGCAKCDKLYELTRRVLQEEGIEAELVKVDRLDEMLKRGVMMVPGLVIDGAVKAMGTVPHPAKLAAWLREAAHG